MRKQSQRDQEIEQKIIDEIEENKIINLSDAARSYIGVRSPEAREKVRHALYTRRARWEPYELLTNQDEDGKRHRGYYRLVNGVGDGGPNQKELEYREKAMRTKMQRHLSAVQNIADSHPELLPDLAERTVKLAGNLIRKRIQYQTHYKLIQAAKRKN